MLTEILLLASLTYSWYIDNIGRSMSNKSPEKQNVHSLSEIEEESWKRNYLKKEKNMETNNDQNGFFNQQFATPTIN